MTLRTSISFYSRTNLKEENIYEECKAHCCCRQSVALAGMIAALTGLPAGTAWAIGPGKPVSRPP